MTETTLAETMLEKGSSKTKRTNHKTTPQYWFSSRSSILWKSLMHMPCVNMSNYFNMNNCFKLKGLLYATMQHYSVNFAHHLCSSEWPSKPACWPDLVSYPSGMWWAFCWAQLVETNPTSSQQLDQLWLQVSSLLLHSWAELHGCCLARGNSLSFSPPLYQTPRSESKSIQPLIPAKQEQNKNPKHRLFARLVSHLLASWTDLLDDQTNTKSPHKLSSRNLASFY